MRLEGGKVRASRDISFCFFLWVIGVRGLVVRGIFVVLREFDKIKLEI